MTAFNSSGDQNLSTPAMESFVGKFRLLGPQGVAGLLKQVPLWAQYAETLSSDQFARCLLAMDFWDLKGEVMTTLAQRFARAKAIDSEEFSQWAVLAVLTIFDDRIFESFLRRVLEMAPLSANEVLEAIMAAPLNYRVEGGTVYNDHPRSSCES